jgi:thiaminase
LAGYKAKTLDEIAAVCSSFVTSSLIVMLIILQSARVVAHITHEVALHIEYCRGFGISKEDMLNTEENEGMWIEKIL